jgi:hypothetical protein
MVGYVLQCDYCLKQIDLESRYIPSDRVAVAAGWIVKSLYSGPHFCSEEHETWYENFVNAPPPHP